MFQHKAKAALVLCGLKITQSHPSSSGGGSGHKSAGGEELDSISLGGKGKAAL